VKQPQADGPIVDRSGGRSRLLQLKRREVIDDGGAAVLHARISLARPVPADPPSRGMDLKREATRPPRAARRPSAWSTKPESTAAPSEGGGHAVTDRGV